MEERRLLLAVALSLLALTAYSMLFPPAPRPRTAPAVASAPVIPGGRPSPEPSPAFEAPVPAPQVADERERRVEVVSAERNLSFSNRGARLLSWQLTRFSDKRGRPEEMVQAAVGGPRPLDIETGDASLDARLRESLFRPSTETLTVPAGGSGDLRFEYADGEIAAEKTLTFDARGPFVLVSASVRKQGRELPLKVLWGPGIGNPTSTEKEVQGYQAPHGVALIGGKVVRPAAEKMTAAENLAGVQWAGVESHYFAALVVPPSGATAAEIRPVALPPLEDGKARPSAVVAVDLLPGSAPLQLYVGPKDYHELTRAGHDLDRVVLAAMGEWIGPSIVVPLMGLVRRVHSVVGNYGWSIVLVTVLINLVMAPFRHFSIANGRKMAKISPEMKVIQERYRKVPLLDPKRQVMQEEMAGLYSRHGMNMGSQMMVGCLPILLTMPFLIAFYRVLSVSIDLRGAAFFWIPDLSQKDPLFLTPVLMGISMFAMQRMTPTPMDPAQQRIMMLMPLMLSGMLLWAPAGLNLYWLSSNLCAIVQQTVTYALLQRAEAPAARGRR